MVKEQQKGGFMQHFSTKRSSFKKNILTFTLY
jgi:hypothetical protein